MGNEWVHHWRQSTDGYGDRCRRQKSDAVQHVTILDRRWPGPLLSSINGVRKSHGQRKSLVVDIKRRYITLPNAMLVQS
jgi:hypothetical protein